MKHLDGLKRPFVEVDGNKLTIAVQDGTVSENGYNGLQAYDIIHLVADMFKSLNEEIPCRENDDTLYYLARAYTSQLERNANRIKRDVEGTYSA